MVSDGFITMLALPLLGARDGAGRWFKVLIATGLIGDVWLPPTSECQE
jgi:hypothetical protein